MSLRVEKASFILERRRRSISEWAVLRMAFLVGLLALLTLVEEEEEEELDSFCVDGGSDVDVEFVFLRLLDDWVSGCGRGVFIWMILRERVGGDGRVKGPASETGLSFLVLAEAVRLRGRPLVDSSGYVILVLMA